MKVRFITTHIDGTKCYPAGSVADYMDGDGQRLVDSGVAEQVHPDTPSRLAPYDTNACAPIEKPAAKKKAIAPPEPEDASIS